ncbi:MAG: VacJ family lipoprotein [Candidatus Parabeggiatoa sp. nov. 3]|nr:MAG: VacJ family lipoprotein [Gammaproteobacteria bacterium]RKZ65252.1 MAG: VacJ family lipoprotein [Gammaproteobacteria bacterium]RKZ77815.1 MAG: VacJ family lipoprotein [Gammaproteobacteria bacterium]
MRNARYYRTVLGLLLGSWILSGCATTTTPHESDPFEGFNRSIFAFNEGVDKAILKPVAKGYKAITPKPVNKGVTNFFSNLDDVIVIANDLLQFKFKQAASDTGRVLLNSTVGLLGLIDVASEFELPKHNEDFGQTLGYWGVGSGPYLVLPLLGPSSARDTVGLGVDVFLDPRLYYTGTPQGLSSNHVIYASEAVKKVDMRADFLEVEKVVEVAALDKYSYYREAYLSRRNYLVYDGNPPQNEDIGDIFDDEDDEDFDEDEEDEDEEDEEDEDE